MQFPVRFRSVLNVGFILPACLAMLVVCGCSSGEELDMGDTAPIPLNEVNASTFTPDGNPVVLRIAAGETIPVNLNVDFGFASLQPGGNQLLFSREVLLYISEDGELYLSPNGQRWAPIHDLDAIKDVFDFDEGEASIGLSVTQEGGTDLNIGIKMKRDD